MNGWHIAVLVPARDEEDLLPRCLHSIAKARLSLPAHVTSDVVVVSDRSSDRTYQIAKEMLGENGCAVAEDFGCVGSARITAASIALQRCKTAPNQCWLANTDADCEVPEQWLLHQLMLAEKGFAAVAGIVDVDSFEEHHPHVRELFRKSYLIHTDGSHPHVHGANLGVRADVYLRAGGWAKLETAEDHDLWNRISKFGYRRLSDAQLQVRTSGRRVGRAPLGFADTLAMHNEVSL